MINKYSNLPFFSLTKNNDNIKFNTIESKNVNKNIKDILQEDFLYKISHQRENEYKGINNNFNKNSKELNGLQFVLFSSKKIIDEGKICFLSIIQDF